MWHNGWNLGVGGILLMMVMMGVFWAAIIATVVWGIRQFRPRDASASGGSTSAMRVLEERFARGEIDADEFQRRREILRGGTG